MKTLTPDHAVAFFEMRAYADALQAERQAATAADIARFGLHAVYAATPEGRKAIAAKARRADTTARRAAFRSHLRRNGGIN